MRKLLASLGLVVFVLSACANSPSNKAANPGDALPALLDAVEKTDGAGSGRIGIDLTFTSPQQTIHITGTVESEKDTKVPEGYITRMVFDIPSFGMVPGGKVELIGNNGSALYVRAPTFASFIPATTPWVKLDLSQLPQSGSGMGAAAAVANPAAILAAIKDALTVEEVGVETVGGSVATHYRAAVDLVKLLPLIAKIEKQQPTDAEMQEAKDQLAKLGLQTLPIDLWVDEDGYLKQGRFSLDLSDVDPDHAGPSFSLTLTFSNFGEDFAIDIPPASQVTDISDLLGDTLSPVTLS
jgi:hypothetical protein